MIKKKIFQFIAKKLFPELAKGMLAANIDPFKTTFTQEEMDDYVSVENNGSDITLFCFAGGAALYAGLPTFEFRKILQTSGANYNLVFFRDIRRIGYHYSPYGKRNGREFYEEKVKEIMKELGSKYNIALGASWGGTAAFYFACRCNMDKIITFGPAINEAHYLGIKVFLLSLFSKAIFSSFKQYIQHLIAIITIQHLVKTFFKEIEEKARWDVVQEYRNHPKRPKATIFYGQSYKPDVKQTELVKDFPEVQLAPLPIDDHHCAPYLKARGELGSAIMKEIEMIVNISKPVKEVFNR